MISELVFDGDLSEKELEILKARVEKFGFSFCVDLGGGRTIEERPKVIRRSEFVKAGITNGGESNLYSGKAWNTLWNLGRHARVSVLDPKPDVPGIPVRFIPGTTSAGRTPWLGDTLLVAETLPPSVEWGKENYDQVRGLTSRMVEVWEKIADYTN